MASPRCLAAATVISIRSLTLACPVNSENSDGRKVISSATSGLVKTSETIRCGIGKRMRKAASADKAKASEQCHRDAASTRALLCDLINRCQKSAQQNDDFLSNPPRQQRLSNRQENCRLAASRAFK